MVLRLFPFSLTINESCNSCQQTKVWVAHTTLPPRYKPSTGLAAKPYLGRHYYVSQLNNALVTVALEQGLQLVDYEQVRR